MRISSKQPRKQRKKLYNLPLHLRWHLMTVLLSDELRKELGIKRLGVHKGDTVRILRGDWKGHEGKVTKIDLKRIRIYVEGVTVKKADGTDVFYPIHPSKAMIVKLGEIDDVRKKIIERKSEARKKLVEMGKAKSFSK